MFFHQSFQVCESGAWPQHTFNIILAAMWDSDWKYTDKTVNIPDANLTYQLISSPRYIDTSMVYATRWYLP